jgi:hypothetical protein
MFRGFFVSGFARQCYSGHFIHCVMSPANTAETDSDEDAPSLPPLPAGVRNYITPAGVCQAQSGVV